ncbi:MAG TPA: hypothetical protein VIR58_18200 [Acidimicrobiales bacterium]
MRSTSGRFIAAALALLFTFGAAAPPAGALPPPSKTVAYADLNVYAECAANGVAGIYAVTGQATPLLPFTTATVRCTVNGQPTIASIPTVVGLIGGFLPLAPLLPTPSEAAVGIAVATGDELRICVIVDTTVTAPLLPPIYNHAERCA